MLQLMDIRFSSRRATWFLCAMLVAALLSFVLLEIDGWLNWRAFCREVSSACQADVGPTLRTSWSFRFEGEIVTLRPSLNTAELNRSAEINTTGLFQEPARWREAYLTHLIDEQSRSRFVSGLAWELGDARFRMELDDDRYLELMARAVQAIPFGDVGTDMRMPIEVVAHGAGVCSEKSILLAALLIHEDYDTVLWYFDTQKHVSVGVRSDAAWFRDSEYAFIETTGQHYVGQAPGRYSQVGMVGRGPQTIFLGGTRTYEAADEVERILSAARTAETRARTLESYEEYAENALYLPERYESGIHERYMALRIGKYIRSNTHDRPGVHEMLLSGSLGRGGGV